MIIDLPITDKERLELFAINGCGTPKTSIFGLRLLKKLKEEQPMTSEELSAMWKELRPKIGNFMCRLDNEVKFIEVHHDEYVTKEEHERECDECYDAGIAVGKHSRQSGYNYAIHQLDKMKEDELVKLFGTDFPLDVLKTNGIDEILEKLCDYFTQEQARNEIDKWYLNEKHKIDAAARESWRKLGSVYLQKLRDIGIHIDGTSIEEDDE